MKSDKEHIFTKQDLKRDLNDIGVRKGDLLHIKVSMKALGTVEGGAGTLLDAILEILGEEGTLVSDAFIKAFPLPLNKEDGSFIPDDNTPSYAGAFANTMIKHPDSYRSKHPIQKFSAIGAKAKQLCDNHTDNSGGYDLLEEMANLNAINLTIGGKVVGVGTTHVAIDKLGFKRKEINKGVNYKTNNGDIKLCKIDWSGGCGRGFPNFYPLYREQGGIISEGKIGDADSVLTSMQRTLEIEINKLKEDPTFFFCDDPACYSCRISWEHSDKRFLKFYFNWLRKNFRGLSFKRLYNLYKSLYKQTH